MANEKVSQLPMVAFATPSDVIYAIQGGISSQETLQQVFNLVSNTIVGNFSGNPNGNLAGSTYNLAWDTTDSMLWVCITSGSISTAVWVPVVGAMTNGQLLVGSTGNAPVRTLITAGAGISITNGSGSITVAATAVGISWTVVTGTTQAMAINSGYVSNNAGLVTLTLPSTAAVGSIIQMQGLGAGGWQIAQNASQLIHIGADVTTTGTAGFLASTNQYDSLTLLCVIANTTWTVLGGPQGNITYN